MEFIEDPHAISISIPIRVSLTHSINPKIHKAYVNVLLTFRGVNNAVLTGTARYGLWKNCTAVLGTTELCTAATYCEKSGDSCSKVQASRAFITLVCLVVPFVVATLILFVTTFHHWNRAFLWIPKGLAAVCFVFGLIGMATGLSAFIDRTGYTPGAAAVLTIIAVILNLIGGVFAGLIN